MMSIVILMVVKIDNPLRSAACSPELTWYSKTLFKPTWDPNMFRKEHCVCEPFWMHSFVNDLIYKTLKPVACTASVNIWG